MTAPAVEVLPGKQALIVGGPDGNAIWLTRAEFFVYMELAKQPGDPVLHDAIQTALYGDREPPRSNCAQVLVSRLRKKLAQAGATQTIRSVRKIGYALVDGGEA